MLTSIIIVSDSLSFSGSLKPRRINVNIFLPPQPPVLNGSNPSTDFDEDSEHGDNERLAVLGEKVLETAVTDTLFRKRPMLKGAEIEVRESGCGTLDPTLTARASVETPEGCAVPQEHRAMAHWLQAA